jgi:DNA mismatch endonuclease (patch repair protein)
MDRLTSRKRSWNMSRIRSRDTGPELLVRSVLHRMGFRFRLHSGQLPGHPDIVLAKLKTVVLVHGCFWHRHPACKYAYIPKSRIVFWQEKFRRNILRDRSVSLALRKLGWKEVIIWECETQERTAVERRLHRSLSPRKDPGRRRITVGS